IKVLAVALLVVVALAFGHGSAAQPAPIASTELGPVAIVAGTGFLAAVGVAICFVVYMLFRHSHRTRHAKKHGHSPHTGHHGNH
ncbi:MAG: hypothetical protein ABL955_16310, partial [Elusimicrobiota bacterium]